jgi:hypothetical protein
MNLLFHKFWAQQLFPVNLLFMLGYFRLIRFIHLKVEVFALGFFGVVVEGIKILVFIENNS